MLKRLVTEGAQTERGEKSAIMLMRSSQRQATGLLKRKALLCRPLFSFLLSYSSSSFNYFLFITTVSFLIMRAEVASKSLKSFPPSRGNIDIDISLSSSRLKFKYFFFILFSTLMAQRRNCENKKERKKRKLERSPARGATTQDLI